MAQMVWAVLGIVRNVKKMRFQKFLFHRLRPTFARVMLKFGVFWKFSLFGSISSNEQIKLNRAIGSPKPNPVLFWGKLTTYSPYQERKRKRSFLAQFVQEILKEPLHQFEKKGQKRPPPSLIMFATFLPLSEETPASYKHNHLFPCSRVSI